MTAAAHDGLPGLPMPAAMAHHDDWAVYAVSRGMDPGEARTLTRDQLRAAFIPSDAPRDDTPYVERLDQDPDTRAARRAASRPAWDRR